MTLHECPTGRGAPPRSIFLNVERKPNGAAILTADLATLTEFCALIFRREQIALNLWKSSEPGFPRIEVHPAVADRVLRHLEGAVTP